MKAWADLYLTRDRKRVVERDDPAHAFTYLRKGKEIPVADVKRYGIEGPKASAPVAEPEPESRPPVVESQPEPEPDASPAQPEPRMMHFGSADPGAGATGDEAPRRRKKAEGE